MCETNLLISIYNFFLRQFVRGFKTDRSIEAELKRNPTMSTRLRDAFSGTPYKLDAEIAQGETLKKLIQKSGDVSSVSDMKYAAFEDSHNNDKPHYLQENNMKIAFAEGYLAGTNAEDVPKANKSSRYLKVTPNS